MATAFISIDRPFYFAGDTVQGQVFLNLYENIMANEVVIKFKGWESVRWFEERIVPEHEKPNIAANLIFNAVTPSLSRCSGSAWIAPTRRTTRERTNLQDINMCKTATCSRKSSGTVERGRSRGSKTCCITSKDRSSRPDSTPSPFPSRLEKITQHPIS